jgi:hypothetical protein
VKERERGMVSKNGIVGRRSKGFLRRRRSWR